jgi:osmotically-inducible protein OsmY
MSEKVRSSFQSDSTLKPLASNVTVQDQEGKVALNGTVKSEAEKQQIVSKAEEIAGSGNVVDNLQVKSDNSNP